MNVVLKFGAPAQRLTDQGSNFLSDLLKSTCKLLRIKDTNHGLPPESNESLERSHVVLTDTTYAKIKPTGMSGSRMQSMYTIPPCTRPPHIRPLNWFMDSSRKYLRP